MKSSVPARLACLLAVCLAWLTACQSARTASPAGSAERGRAFFFDADFGDAYRTAVPYAFYLGMMRLYPELLAKDWDDFSSRYGLLRRPGEPGGLPVGFALRPDRLTGTPFLMTNCSLCHQGEIAGRRIEGIGSTTLRLNAINNAIAEVSRRPDFTADRMIAAARAAAAEARLPWSWRADLATRIAVNKLRELGRSNVAIDAGPGRNTPIEFAKMACAVPVTPPYGFVKFPAAWMYRERDTFGYDASFVGERELAVSAVEFNKGMSPRAILRQPQTWRDVFAYMQSLRAPVYPWATQADLLPAGRNLYAAQCQDCHGGNGGGYRELVVPLGEVGTDADRFDAVTSEFVAARNRTELSRFTRLVQPSGYVAPPLDGIWARAPYLHNGSVPTLADLLKPAEQRPTRFPVGAGVEYDLARVGLASSPAARDGRQFDVAGPGNSNRGHAYGTTLAPEEKTALIEFLKTL